MAPAFQDVQTAPTHNRRRQPDTTVSPTSEEHGPSKTRRRLLESAQGLPASPLKDAESSHLARVGKDIDELAERVAHIEPSDAPWFVGRAVFDAKSRRPHGVQGRIQIVDLD